MHIEEGKKQHLPSGHNIVPGRATETASELAQPEEAIGYQCNISPSEIRACKSVLGHGII